MANRKWDAAFEAMNAKLDELGEQAKASIDAAQNARHEKKDAIDDKISETKGDLVAAQEMAREAGERSKSKLSTELLKVQMRVGAVQDKIQEKKDAIDKKGLELYIEDMLADASDYYAGAMILLENARLAMLEAASAAAEYEEKYGEA